MKVCFRCKAEKDLSEFNKDKFKPDGMSTYCRKCANEKKKDPNKLWKHIKREPWVEGDICYIPMTRGKIAMCDADMYDAVIGHQWRPDGFGYPCMQIERRTYLLHRMVMERIEPDFEQVDHIDHNILDNRRSNLRVATASDNAANKRLTKSNKTGYKAVFFNKKTNKWTVTVKKHGKNNRIGSFTTKEQAAIAYNEAAKIIHGEFAWLNEISQPQS